MGHTEVVRQNRNPARRLFRYVCWALACATGLIVLSALGLGALIWHDERRRIALIDSYQTPDFYLNMLGSLEGTHPLSVLMNNDETLMCLVQHHTLGNLQIGRIDGLSDAQRSSAQREALPSPDSSGGYWYLLFFKRDELSRTYLSGTHLLDFEAPTQNCYGRSVEFKVSNATGQPWPVRVTINR